MTNGNATDQAHPYDPHRSAEQRRAEMRQAAHAIGVTEDLISDLVDRFYARVRRDSEIGPIFDQVIGDDWDHHLPTMKAFWSSVALSSGKYSGRPMPAHLRLKMIRPEHFQRWLALFRQTLEEIAPSEAAVDHFMERAQRIAHSLQLALFHLPIAR